MPTQAELRRAWTPSCQKKHRTGLVELWLAVNAIMRRHAYKPRKGETFAANCRPVTGGNEPSFHAFMDDTTWETWTGVLVQTALATDFNSTTNPYGTHLVTDMPRAMVDEILAIRTNNGRPALAWGGYFKRHKDAMHYEVACFPADLATGLDPSTLPSPQQPPQQEEEDMFLVIGWEGGPALWYFYPAIGKKVTIPNLAALDEATKGKAFGGYQKMASDDVRAIPYLDPEKPPNS